MATQLHIPWEQFFDFLVFVTKPNRGDCIPPNYNVNSFLVLAIIAYFSIFQLICTFLSLGYCSFHETFPFLQNVPQNYTAIIPKMIPHHREHKETSECPIVLK
jgi:hypothetical protein